jgi:hypothetical protein
VLKRGARDRRATATEYLMSAIDAVEEIHLFLSWFLQQTTFCCARLIVMEILALSHLVFMYL